MKYLLFFFPLLTFIFFTTCQKSPRLMVTFPVLSDTLSAEEQAAIQFLRESSEFDVQFIPAVNITAEIQNAEILWLHIPDSSSYQKWLSHRDKLQLLRSCYDAGGKLLLTDYASLLPYEWGVESQKPSIETVDIKDDWLFDKKGLQSFRGHPVFSGLFGGTFLWDAYQDHQLDAIGYFENDFPADGRVVAVAKSYIRIHGNHKLMTEYRKDGGRMITVGAFVIFSERNRLQQHLNKFISNCLMYLRGDLNEGPETYWKKYELKPQEFSISTAELSPAVSSGIKPETIPDMLLKRSPAGENFYDINGRRALVMGQEKGGIDELWIHPFMVLRDYQAGIAWNDSVLWLKHLPVSVEIRPESFTRNYTLPEGNLREVIVPALNKPGIIIHYDFQTAFPQRLIIKYRTNLRWMWPYDENAVGDIWYAYDPELEAFHFRDSSEDLYGVVGADQSPIAHFAGQYADIVWDGQGFTGEKTDLNQVYQAFEFDIGSGGNNILNIAVAGTNMGQQKALDTYQTLLSDPRKVYDAGFSHYQNLLERTVQIESPDPQFNQFWKWAIVGTDRFLAHTPGVGTGLLAGFSTTARGWGGGHKISGRPGYAWYFGRDSEWAGFAIDDYGDVELVKQQLEFLQKYQDISGKIFHEISTSGVVHFDAADATPLYIILAAHYLRASGDVNFIRRSWNHIQKALEFLYSTDTDQDLLIENTNVGHGWVEGGKLWGAHTTLYLAALWAQTLRESAYMAACLDKNTWAERYNREADQIIQIINSDFWNDSTGFYHYGKMKDGSYNPERTVLPAVGMYYGLMDRDKVETMLEEFSGNGFSTNWGVRIVSSESPLFVPYGYHYGSVWPLFTGWTALAEYRYGNSIQGFTHMVNNLLIKNYWACGFVEEVMHGALYQPSGVCPHQCWSETNILHPAIFGMVGWQPDAPNRKVLLAPAFPWHWDGVSVNNLIAGETVINLRMKRTKNLTVYTIQLAAGPEIECEFSPELPLGLELMETTLDGKPVEGKALSEASNQQFTMNFQLNSIHKIQLVHHKGIGAVPYIPVPQPGDTAIGYRIVDQELQDNQFTLLIQGLQSTSSEIRVQIYDHTISRIEGAEQMELRADGLLKLSVPFPFSEKAYSEQRVILYLDV